MPVPFEAKDFCSTVGFQFAQLFEQALGAFLLGIELGNERVVFDFLLHFAILCGEVGVLVFHFAAVHFSDLPEFSQFFILSLFELQPARHPPAMRTAMRAMKICVSVFIVVCGFVVGKLRRGNACL